MGLPEKDLAYATGVDATRSSNTFTVVSTSTSVPSLPDCTPLAIVAKDFTVLLKAAEAAGLLGTLTAKDASFTIFAPTDAAFKKLLAVLGVSLEQVLADKATLKLILLYHVLAKPVKASDIRFGQKISTLLTKDISPCGEVFIQAVVCHSYNSIFLSLSLNLSALLVINMNS